MQKTEDPYDNNFLGSGYSLAKDVAEYGIENFEKKILKAYPNQSTLYRGSAVIIEHPDTKKHYHLTEDSMRNRRKWNKSEKNIKALNKYKKIRVEKSLTPEARLKQKRRLAETNHQQGKRNSQYGTMWITDGNTTMKIKRGDPIPQGFRRGRK